MQTLKRSFSTFITCNLRVAVPIIVNSTSFFVSSPVIKTDKNASIADSLENVSNALASFSSVI